MVMKKITGVSGVCVREREVSGVCVFFDQDYEFLWVL